MTSFNSQINTIKVPWEPYKAATNLNSKDLFNKHSTSSTSNNMITNKKDLIKYKIDTNLEKFNSNRPGYQFDEFDFKLIESNQVNLEDNINELLLKSKIKSNSNDLSTSLAKDMVNNLNNDEESSSKLPPNFVDARFYTDAHFLKLANQLKKNSMLKSFDNLSCSNKTLTNNISKPVNVVGPMFEKKKEPPIGNFEALSRTTSVDSNTSKLWKAQCEQYEARINYLENQMKGINEQLQIQTQVNVELKKMLVASVGGEDLQYKLERLINDKQRYEFELDNKTKMIEKMTEEIEQISIQCDLWRSKFLASKLLSEENQIWKSFLLMLNAQNEKIIKNLLSDNELLNLKLNQGLDLLVSYVEKTKNESKQHGSNSPSSFSSSFLSLPSYNKHKNLNNLQAVNIILSNLCTLGQPMSTINSKLLTELNTKLTNFSSKKRSKTINEIVAEQALEQFDWIKTTVQTNSNIPSNQTNLNMIDNLDNLDQLIRKIKDNRLSRFSRLYQPESVTEADLLLDVCNKCKGDIKIV